MNKKTTQKLNFCSPYIWRKIFLYKKTPIFRTEKKYVYSRFSIIPKILNNSNVSIYNGKKWHNRFIIKWMIGFKFGEFTWNRKIALYKAKQLKKKKK